MQLLTGVKEIQQLNPVGQTTDKTSDPNPLSYSKSLSRSHHRFCGPTHRRTIKEESKVGNRNWVDHQACSLLQYINVIANRFTINNYFNELR